MKPESVLEIFVGPACIASETARRLAGAVQALARPGLEVRLIELDEPGAVRPAAVFAVPTYILNGRVISLGNPEEDWLLTRVGASGPAGGMGSCRRPR